jgi:DNA-binding MarR family transcriptional regulator
VSPIFGWLETPQESHDEDGNFRPTVLMKRVSEYLERSPGGSLRAIRMAVKGKGASIDIAVETLIREGYIRVEKGTRDASFHFLIRPFDDKE